MINLIISLILPFTWFLSSAEQTNEKTLFYHDMVYEQKIKSVLITKKGSDERFPIMNLGQVEAFNFSFDALEAENDYFQYTYVHCDKDWKPSSLNQTDYIKGSQFLEIENFKFSSNTYVSYTHYNFSFPTSKMIPRIAGNYILKVYRNFDEEDLILTKRFMVINNKVKVTGRVNSATNVNLRFTHQEVDFFVNAEKYVMPNPFQDLHAVVVQNYSWMNVTAPIKPQFANSNVYTFNYEKENTLQGLKEFRFIDLRGLRNITGGVKKQYYDSVSKQIVVVPFTDQCRGGLTYVFWKDNNGKPVYENKDLPNVTNSEDYFIAAFGLKKNALIGIDDKVYVLGEFNNWRPSKETEMILDDKGVYRSRFSLKQGYHNYLYATLNSKGELDYTATEGSRMETENDYRVLVYHKNQFLRYDELVGFLYLNSLYANKKE
jgi:hypothetical protein